MKTWLKIVRLNVKVVILVLLVSACGGGGGGESSGGGTGGGGTGGTTNSSPTVSVNSTATVISGNSFSVTASATDSDGSIASYSWSQVSGSSVSISDSASSTLSFTAPSVTSDSVLEFTITVTDNDGSTASANIAVTIVTSSVGVAPTITLPLLSTVNSGDSFSITAVANDSDGSISSYFWSQTSGQSVNISNSSSSSLNFTAPNVSNNTVLGFSILVTDNDGMTAAVDIQVTVLGVNETTLLKGKILNLKLGIPVEGAIVSSGNKTTITDSNGYYELADLPYNTRTIVNATHPDYAMQSKIVNVSSTENDVKLTLKSTPIAIAEVFGQSNPRIIYDTNSPASIAISANTLVDTSGIVYPLSITGKLTFLNPSQISDVLSGDYIAEVGNQNLPFESFGGVNATFEDASANPLVLKSDSTAIIRIPVRSKNDIITENPSDIAPPTLPLFYYDEFTGKWVEEGFATFKRAALNSYYEGEISHLATWSTGVIYDTVNISGCVVDLNSNPLSGITVVTDGDNYSGGTKTTTDSNGNFVIKAKEDSDILLWATNSGVRSNTIVASTSFSDASVNSCLSIADLAITITLSWGFEPRDLDAHLYGPSYHILWSDKGDLTGFPWARLDVDDFAQLGPEVITIVALPDVGTYTYKVNNFSQNHSVGMFGSGAKVEFNFNGDVMLFTPPQGELLNNVWNVFNLNVASPGLFTVERIDTWDKNL